MRTSNEVLLMFSDMYVETKMFINILKEYRESFNKVDHNLLGLFNELNNEIKEFLRNPDVIQTDEDYRFDIDFNVFKAYPRMMCTICDVVISARKNSITSHANGRRHTEHVSLLKSSTKDIKKVLKATERPARKIISEKTQSKAKLIKLRKEVRTLLLNVDAPIKRKITKTRKNYGNRNSTPVKRFPANDQDISEEYRNNKKRNFDNSRSTEVIGRMFSDTDMKKEYDRFNECLTENYIKDKYRGFDKLNNKEPLNNEPFVNNCSKFEQLKSIRVNFERFENNRGLLENIDNNSDELANLRNGSGFSQSFGSGNFGNDRNNSGLFRNTRSDLNFLKNDQGSDRYSIGDVEDLLNNDFIGSRKKFDNISGFIGNNRDRFEEDSNTFGNNTINLINKPTTSGNMLSQLQRTFLGDEHGRFGNTRDIHTGINRYNDKIQKDFVSERNFGNFTS